MNINFLENTGATPLGRVLNDRYLPEDLVGARAQLRSSLSDLSSYQSDSLRRVLGGSQLAEDLVGARSAAKGILGSHSFAW